MELTFRKWESTGSERRRSRLSVLGNFLFSTVGDILKIEREKKEKKKKKGSWLKCGSWNGRSFSFHFHPKRSGGELVGGFIVVEDCDCMSWGLALDGSDWKRSDNSPSSTTTTRRPPSPASQKKRLLRMVVVVAVGGEMMKDIFRNGWMDGWMESRQDKRQISEIGRKKRERESRVPFSRNETTFRPAKVGSGEMCAD